MIGMRHAIGVTVLRSRALAIDRGNLERPQLFLALPAAYIKMTVLQMTAAGLDQERSGITGNFPTQIACRRLWAGIPRR